MMSSEQERQTFWKTCAAAGFNIDHFMIKDNRGEGTVQVSRNTGAHLGIYIQASWVALATDDLKNGKFGGP